MKPIQIHKSKESELQSIAMLEAACFHDPWPLEQVIYEWKENPVANLYSATSDGFHGFTPLQSFSKEGLPDQGVLAVTECGAELSAP